MHPFIFKDTGTERVSSARRANPSMAEFEKAGKSTFALIFSDKISEFIS
jgi:hypothetical protein